MDDDYFEYKFVIRDSQGPFVRWQQGENNIFDLKRLLLTVKQLQMHGNQQVNIDRRTKIRLESSSSSYKNNNKDKNDTLIININFE